MKFQILICSIESRHEYLKRLMTILQPQLVEGVSIQVATDNGKMTIGQKRNELLQQSPAEYVAFIDDDDRVSDDYVKLILKGISHGVDCCSLKGEITENGKNPQIFEHSIRYFAYRTNEFSYVKYERYPNHLNCIKASIAKQFKFPEKNHGEDTDWATQIHKSGLIKTEHYIPEVIYHYDYISNK